MECAGLLFVVVIGVLVYIALRNQPETRTPQPPEQPSGSPLNGLFALFLLDHWLDGGAHGLFGEADDPQEAMENDDDNGGDDLDEDDGYWDNQAGF